MAPDLTPRRLAACAPSFLVGAVCLLLRTFIFTRFPLESFIKQGGLGTDENFLFRLILPARARAILEAGANHPAGVLVVGELCVLHFIRSLLGGVESCRARAHLALELTSLRLAQMLATALSGCFAFCLFWLSYLLSGGGPRSTRNIKKSALAARVVNIWDGAAFSVLTPSFFALTSAYHHPDAYVSWLNVCYLAAPCLGLFFCILSIEPSPPITIHSPQDGKRSSLALPVRRRIHTPMAAGHTGSALPRPFFSDPDLSAANGENGLRDLRNSPAVFSDRPDWAHAMLELHGIL